VVTGGHVTIKQGETVGDVTVLGGSLDVFGDVEGDLSVFGGESEIHEGGEVHGDAVTLGGSLTVDDGADVDGDVSVIGGSLHRGDKAKIGGSARDEKGELNVSIDSDESAKEGMKAHRAFPSIMATAMSESALMFVFGAVLLALLTKRVDALKVEVASRPMRSFAMGIVGSIVGVIALVALCITIIGIPLAIVGMLAAALAVYGSITAVLTTLGQALLGHKTSNPYMHLALGCALLFVTGSIPVVGPFAAAAVVFTAIGALIATRAAGLVPPRARTTPSDPYRTASP
jgi:MFS family permease